MNPDLRVTRILGAFGLQPRRQATFKPSSDPLFAGKVRDIVGLYLDPPLKAVVLCVDDKRQIRQLTARNPSHLILPLAPGFPERRTHDQLRDGTTTWFAALDIATGAVMGETHRRHRSSELMQFLPTMEANVSTDWGIHRVKDNHGTHKTPTIRSWLAKLCGFTPTSRPTLRRR